MSLCLCMTNCSNTESELICDPANSQRCMTVIQNLPFVDEKGSGIIFIYGNGLDQKINSVHVRYMDAPFYYRWKGDTLLLRCPYFKVVADNSAGNPKFNFSEYFTNQEKIDYGYDTDSFYINVLKDFTAINTYKLK